MNPRNYIFNSPSLLFTGTIGQNTCMGTKYFNIIIQMKDQMENIDHSSREKPFTFALS
jgi:hypothetical protein